MKFKKAKKFEQALVAVLEFVRVTAHTNPKVVAEVLQTMGLKEESFVPHVNRLVRLALKTTDAVGDRIDDVLRELRRESERRDELIETAKELYNAAHPESEDGDDIPDCCSDDEN